MSKIWKVIGIVMSVVVIGALGFCGIWTVRNWNTVYSSFDGTSFYTYEDMQKLKQDTIDQCAKNEVEYQNTIAEFRETISSLNERLKALNLQIENTDVLHKAEVVELNKQVAKLNNQVSELSVLTEDASSQIASLNKNINELEISISYYENLIASSISSNQAVATYEIDGSVWKIEIINKGEEFNLPTPINTETMIFHNWKLKDTDTVLGTTYTMNENTKFVANIIKKYAVQFMVEDQLYNNQYVIENEYASIPEVPTKEDYDFMGWSINGVDIVENIDTLSVSQNVTYVAIFKKFHTVTIAGLKDVRVEDQKIYSEYTFNDYYKDTYGAVPAKSGYTFRGWSLVDPASDDFVYSSSFYDIDSIIEDITVYPVLVSSSTPSLSKSLSISSYVVGTNRSVTASFGDIGSSSAKVVKASYNVSVTQYIDSASNTFTTLSNKTINSVNIYGTQTLSGNSCSVTNYRCNITAYHSYSADNGFSLKINYNTVSGQSSVTSVNFTVMLFYNLIYTGDLA